MFEDLPFEPFRLFQSSHFQTIVGAFFSMSKEPPSVTRFIQLPDGDEIALEITQPREWTPRDPTVFMLHGLGGSHKACYLVRMANRLMKQNIRCIRMNMRGCGSGKGKARRFYHGGSSDDLLHVLKEIVFETPRSPITLLGFSLGGNIMLKLAGELQHRANGFIHQLISVCPPVDLLSSIQRFEDPKNRVYQRYFLKLLKGQIQDRNRCFPDLPELNFPERMTMYEFDQLFTAPEAGYASAIEYYEKSSSKNCIGKITVKCRIIFSKDDPIICSSSLDEMDLPENVNIYKTEKGGHVGYIGKPGTKNFRWLDQLLESWILEEFS